MRLDQTATLTVDYPKQKQANLQYVKQSTLIRLMSE